MRVGTILEFSRRTLPQLLRCIPDLLRDDGFMGISKNDQLVLGCLAAFLDFEILADRLAKDCVSQIFLTVKNILRIFLLKYPIRQEISFFNYCLF